ncbi:MAG: arylsulfatase [Candidatus Omnitrophota bacterium]|nr:MAG: arylsulfatase [Candidatus Omnitrophota bacterium]
MHHSQAASNDATRPNIILIMADDMGFSDLGCYGSEISTPNLDRLAEKGMRFTNFYNCARCCPTRASLLTGLYPHQAGVGHMVNHRGFPAYQGYLNRHCVTIAEAIRRGGYHALMSGKWHVGEERPHWPLDRGFERYYGLISGASNFWKLDEGRKFARGNEPITDLGDEFYMTDAFTDNAIAMIDEYGKKDDPFFLYLAYTSPHWPLHAWPEDIEKYKGVYDIGWDELRLCRHERMIEMGIVDARWPLTPRDERAPAWKDAEHKEWEAMRMAVYAAQIDRMDQNIGKLMAKVRELGVEDNTLILFLADNGGCAEDRPGNDPTVMPGPKETFMSYELPWANASNTPFRRYKHWVHEGGIATPLIAYWPSVIQPRQLTNQTGHVIDLMATCLDVAGIDYPETHDGNEIIPLEGKSLRPIFEGAIRESHEAIYWEHEGNRALRQGKWKLVSNHPGDWELYDLEVDRTELNDLSETYPEKKKELASLYETWAERCRVLPWDVVTKKKD